MNLHAQWIIGFIDGNGSFNVCIKTNPKTHSGFEILPEFVVTVPEREKQVLYALKSYFGCGYVKENSFSIRNYKHLYDKIIPFFEKHKLLTKKRVDFEKFRFVIISMIQGKHLTSENLDSAKDLKECFRYFQNKDK
jgi:hypothetical protein